MEKPLIIMALESEGQGKIETLGHDVIYCGVGKVNAGYHLMKALHNGTDYSHVLNIGSAGSSTFKTGSLVGAHHFVQRDMDATGIGFDIGQTPFESEKIAIEFPKHFDHLEHGVCGSGDSFLQGASPVPCDIIDMEAYALAKLCQLEKMPFVCAKYITDGADEGASTDWETNLKHAADAFMKLLNS